MRRPELKKLGITFDDEAPKSCWFDFNNHAINIQLNEERLKRCKTSIEVIEEIVLQAKNLFTRKGKEERQREIKDLFNQILK